MTLDSLIAEECAVHRERVRLLEAALEPFAILAQAHMPEDYKYPVVEIGLPGHPPIYADDLRRAAKAMGRELR